MIAAQESVIRSVSIHRVGNATLEEPLKISEAPLELDDEKVTALLRIYFLGNFNTPEYYSFSDAAAETASVSVHELVREMFNEPEAFHESSVAIARHLYESGKHPGIKAGDLFEHAAPLRQPAMDRPAQQREHAGLEPGRNAVDVSEEAHAARTASRKAAPAGGKVLRG